MEPERRALWAEWRGGGRWPTIDPAKRASRDVNTVVVGESNDVKTPFYPFSKFPGYGLPRGVRGWFGMEDLRADEGKGQRGKQL
ncbi:hypothetical protein GE061_011579 [Apolygus lucorum]|uniref:Uncharacterized protein n=1 Tax=Apolygus lucorum TaxID=248454 RepID=A0A6A4KAK8_APOLU|nr:hypothetical protein GE061_011579 [Apolygus lucorum]